MAHRDDDDKRKNPEAWAHPARGVCRACGCEAPEANDLTDCDTCEARRAPPSYKDQYVAHLVAENNRADFRELPGVMPRVSFAPGTK